jgi:DNA-binding XRE family transcriptional regulator
MARPERTEPVLYNRLAVLRVERNLTRQELAEGLEVNYQTIGYLERGEYNPSLDLALRAAEFFGLPVEAIFSRRALAPMSSQLYPPTAGSVARVPSSPEQTVSRGEVIFPGANETHAARRSASRSATAMSDGTCSKPRSVNGVPSNRSAGVRQPISPWSRW